MSRISKSERIALWLDRLNRYACSELTVAEFCQLEQISSASFYHWRRRLSPQVKSPSQPQGNFQVSHAASRSAAGQPPFAELLVNSATSAQAMLPGGITISLGTQPEIVSLIVDRLLQHANGSLTDEAWSC